MAETIAAVWRGECESDSLNRLVTLTELDWHQVQILRALRKYRMRVSSRYTEEYRNDAMAAHGEIAAKLVHLFEARFDPERDASEEAIDEVRQAIHQDLRQVTSLDQDNILRSLLGHGRSDRSHERLPRGPARPELQAAFGARAGDAEALPVVRDLRVLAADGGIHLRGGMVARGGIRWSDRKEDYRTEVLGLMKAQKVKNAIIVPDGSKGGFILKRVTVTPDELRAEVSTQYVTFMRGVARHHRQPRRTARSCTRRACG